MADVREAVRQLGGAFLDPWVLLDGANTVVDFDARFRGLFARHQARKLKGSRCCQFLRFDVCTDDMHLATRCQSEGRTVRFEEIEAQLDGESEPRRFTLAATPLEDGSALVALRDVTDVASMQQKYRELHGNQTREVDVLQAELARKTKALLDTHLELNRVQSELTRHKKGLFG
jgi:nitrogen-specific signal transduction histidine kinase